MSNDVGFDVTLRLSHTLSDGILSSANEEKPLPDRRLGEANILSYYVSERMPR